MTFALAWNGRRRLVAARARKQVMFFRVPLPPPTAPHRTAPHRTAPHRTVPHRK